MSDITVGLKDYSMLSVSCERGIAAELSDYFSFFVPGYKWMPAYKNKAWDGKIRLFNALQGELNAGLFVYLIEFCKNHGYTVDIEETDYGFPIPKAQIEDEKHMCGNSYYQEHMGTAKLVDNEGNQIKDPSKWCSNWFLPKGE